MKKISIQLILIAILLTNCERDDICAESAPTTPRLLIEFYDAENPDTLKAVTNLLIIGEGQTEALENDNGATISSPSTFSLPLRTTDDTTTYTLYKDYEEDADGNITGGNPDTVTITYAREEVYVSRACGFKTVFNNFLIEVENDTDNWISTALRADGITNIENENQVHIYIRH